MLPGSAVDGTVNPGSTPPDGHEVPDCANIGQCRSKGASAHIGPVRLVDTDKGVVKAYEVTVVTRCAEFGEREKARTENDWQKSGHVPSLSGATGNQTAGANL